MFQGDAHRICLTGTAAQTSRIARACPRGAFPPRLGPEDRTPFLSTPQLGSEVGRRGRLSDTPLGPETATRRSLVRRYDIDGWVVSTDCRATDIGTSLDE